MMSMGLVLGLLGIIVCCLVIWRASDGFEVASAYLGKNLSDGVRGATINAIGSSIPELFTTFFFFYYFASLLNDPERANDGFAGGIGTTAGSAIFNGMVIPAVVILAVLGLGLAKRVNVSQKVILRDGIALLLAELALIFIISGSTLYWWHGAILMLIYGIYLLVMFRLMSTSEEEEGEEEAFDFEQGSWIKNVLTLNLAPMFIKDAMDNRIGWRLLIVSMLIIGLACFFLVISCEAVGESLGIKTYFIAVILASAATSVPDTIISYRDALKGEYDDAVANALGSNIFDICFALGLPLFIFSLWQGPITMTYSTIEDVAELRVLLFSLTFAAFLVFLIRKGMGWGKAILLLALYGFFVTYIMAKAYEVEWAVDLGARLTSLVM